MITLCIFWTLFLGSGSQLEVKYHDCSGFMEPECLLCLLQCNFKSQAKPNPLTSSKYIEPNQTSWIQVKRRSHTFILETAMWNYLPQSPWQEAVSHHVVKWWATDLACYSLKGGVSFAIPQKMLNWQVKMVKIFLTTCNLTKYTVFQTQDILQWFIDFYEDFCKETLTFHQIAFDQKDWLRTWASSDPFLFHSKSHESFVFFPK